MFHDPSGHIVPATGFPARPALPDSPIRRRWLSIAQPPPSCAHIVMPAPYRHARTCSGYPHGRPVETVERDARNKSTAVRFSHRGEPNGVSGAHRVCDPPLAREARTPLFGRIRAGSFVMPGLVPGIHTAARLSRLREIPGTSPGMTIWGGYDDVRAGPPGVDPGPGFHKPARDVCMQQRPVGGEEGPSGLAGERLRPERALRPASPPVRGEGRLQPSFLLRGPGAGPFSARILRGRPCARRRAFRGGAVRAPDCAREAEGAPLLSASHGFSKNWCRPAAQHPGRRLRSPLPLGAL